ncbi:MAG: hypothetical protein RLZZ282_716, partial [Verrucomicrobiota bacterium]
MNFSRSNHSSGNLPDPVTVAESGSGNLFGQFPSALWQKALLFSVAYFFCAEVGVHLSVRNSPLVTFWLPAGLYVAVLLLNETRAWPWLILAALPANLAFDLSIGTPLLVIFCFYGANTVQAVTGAWLVRRFVAERPTLATNREFIGLLFFSGGFSTLLGAILGATTLVASGLSRSFAAAWIGWWGTTALGILVLTPLILTWFSGPDAYYQRLFTPRNKKLEAALLAVVTIATTWIFLFKGHGIMSPNKGAFWLLVLWAAFRFGTRGATAACLLVALPTAFFTRQFFTGLTPEQIATGEYVFVMQFSMVVMSLAGLLPAVILRERDQNMVDLRESEDRHRVVLEAAKDGFWIVDLQGRFLQVNQAYCRMSGYSQEELLAMRIENMEANESPEDVSAHLRKIIAEGELLFVSRHRRKDGSVFDIEVSAQFQPAEKKCVAFIRDITERKQAEDAIRDMNAVLDQRVRERTSELEAVVHELDAFSYSVSHDLRAPLRAVDGFSRILADDCASLLDENGLRLLGVIRS